MANEKLITLEQLGTVKSYIDEKDAKALKSFSYEDNVLKLYTTGDASGEPAGEIDFPEEMFLDQTKTKLVDEFGWSETEYPGSEDPDLDGKPVLVLAVKGDETVTYSFISVASIIPTFTGEVSETAEVTVADGAIKADIKISEEEGNALSVKADGLYVEQSDGTAGITFATNQEVEDLFS